jgi:hypothetical protein
MGVSNIDNLAPGLIRRSTNSQSANARGIASIASGNFRSVLGERLQTTLDGVFQDAGSRYGLDPALLKAVAAAESDFDPGAVSDKGAVGLMQIMPDTARSLGVDPRDPSQSIFGAAKYLRSLLNMFNGDLRLAVAGYNAGPGAVMKYNGIPPYQETQNYVRHVLDLMEKYESGGPGQVRGLIQGHSAVPGGRPAPSLAGAGAPSSAGNDNLGNIQSPGTISETLQVWTQYQQLLALSQLESSTAAGTSLDYEISERNEAGLIDMMIGGWMIGGWMIGGWMIGA